MNSAERELFPFWLCGMQTGWMELQQPTVDHEETWKMKATYYDDEMETET